MSVVSEATADRRMQLPNQLFIRSGPDMVHWTLNKKFTFKFIRNCTCWFKISQRKISSNCSLWPREEYRGWSNRRSKTATIKSIILFIRSTYKSKEKSSKFQEISRKFLRYVTASCGQEKSAVSEATADRRLQLSNQLFIVWPVASSATQTRLHYPIEDTHLSHNTHT
jgi:hypothetical protein